MQKQIFIKEYIYIFTLNALRFLKDAPENRVTRIILNQVIRSLTSIGVNIVEAKASNSRKDFARYFDTALK